jgi:hypothetical protein
MNATNTETVTPQIKHSCTEPTSMKKPMFFPYPVRITAFIGNFSLLSYTDITRTTVQDTCIHVTAYS